MANTSSKSETAGRGDERRRLDRALADAMRVVWNVLLGLTIADRLSMIGKCRSILDSIEAGAIAAQLDSGVPVRKAEDLLDSSAGGGASKRTVKRKAKRGAALVENPDLAKKVASGELSEEQVDVLADASAKTGGDAARDPQLIAKIGAAPPEQAKKIADAYVLDQQSQDEVDDAHNQARRRRRVRRYRNEERGTDVLSIEGAPIDIDAIEAQIDNVADRFYREDGGRDVSGNDHRRTRDQRRFDAASALIARTSLAHADAPGEPVPETSRPTRKTAVVLRASLDQALGNDASPLTRVRKPLAPQNSSNKTSWYVATSAIASSSPGANVAINTYASPPLSSISTCSPGERSCICSTKKSLNLTSPLVICLSV